MEAGNAGEQMALSCCRFRQTARRYCASGVRMQQLYRGDTVRTISKGDRVALCWVCVHIFSCQRTRAGLTIYITEVIILTGIEIVICTVLNSAFAQPVLGGLGKGWLRKNDV